MRTDGLLRQPVAGPTSPGAARIDGALVAALGGGASTGNDYQLNVMPSRAVRLVLLFCPEGGGRGQRRRGARSADPREDHDLDSDQVACLRQSARVSGLPGGAALHSRARSDLRYVLDKQTSRHIIRKASLIMGDLRTKKREKVRLEINEPDGSGLRRISLPINNLRSNGMWQARPWINDQPSHNQSWATRKENGHVVS